MTPQRRKNPLTPADLHKVLSRMDDPYAWMASSMACTGMGPSEYWGEWTVVNDRIYIRGTKRAGRDRVVPKFAPVCEPATEYAAFRRALRDASDGQIAPYDLRRTFANWLESAGIPRTRRRLYMGHGAKDVTDLYEAHEVARFIYEDGAKLLAYMGGATENTGLRLEKA